MKVWEEQQILDLLCKSPKFVIRCMMVLYDEQTPEEKSVGKALVKDGRGYNKYDAVVISKFVDKYNHNGGFDLDDIAVVRNIVKKYSKKLCRKANEAELQREQIALQKLEIEKRQMMLRGLNSHYCIPDEVYEVFGREIAQEVFDDFE